MIKRIILFYLLSSIVLLSQNLTRYIDVKGTAEIQVDADYINFVISNRNVSETLKESNQLNTQTNDELIKVFSEFNLLKNDWEISPIKFGKEYSRLRDERKFIGFYSNTNIKVTLHKIEEYYSFVSKLSEIQNIEIVRSEYGLSDFIKYHKKATIQASKNAFEKAQYIVESLDMKLGKIIQIDELSNYQNSPNPFNSAITISNSDESMVGKINIVRSVNMKVEIEN